ncbi:hypothetical protein SUGI_0026030 [Cryptomeria japonica]|nr:hypothetical protein SUGI_0026030 [Cryptomeria japonica]
MKNVKKLCVVKLDIVGSKLQVVNKNERAIELEVDAFVTLTPDLNKEASSQVLPINFGGLAQAVKQGDTIFLGHYLFTRSETASMWLEVSEI